MKKVLLYFTLLSISIYANDVSLSKIVKLSKKGAKIVSVMCDKEKLPVSKGTIDDIKNSIITSSACKSLSKRKLEAVAYFISNGEMKLNSKHLDVPHGAKCPVCGMFVSKYPKWAALIDLNGKRYYFDGVKDMMKYYIFDVDFPYDRASISHIKVTDFYTLDSIDAREAFYVYDSELFGPMGREFIPFASKKAAENFQSDHGGIFILRFKDITPKLVMALDGIEFNG